MRDASLRWGLGIGGAGSALGIVVLFIAARLLPVSATDTNQSFELAMTLILTQLVIRFGMLGVMLSGAYYAGVRVERERLEGLEALRERDGEATGALPAAGTGAITDRRGSLIAGVIVLFCYWLVSTLFGLLVPPAPQSVTTRGSALDIVETALLSGALFLTFGAAMGSLGGRSARARAGVSGAFGGTTGVGRSLLDRIAIPPLAPSQSVSQSVAAPAAPTPTPATSADAPVAPHPPHRSSE
jgi:multisubunit Na+/H+ antiporter MnhC subunit